MRTKLVKFKTRVVSMLWPLLVGSLVFVQHAAAAAGGSDISSNKGLIALGMGLAVGLSALGTGIAQARIGAAGLGSAVEKPESLGLALIFLLLPETLVIFGLVIAFILLGRL